MRVEDVYILLPYIPAFLVLLWVFKKKIQERGEAKRKWRMFAMERGLSETERGLKELGPFEIKESRLTIEKSGLIKDPAGA